MPDTETRIKAYRNGPFLVRGPFTLRDSGGGEFGTERNIVALCRCGRSGTRPFCDGTHKAIGFKASGTPES